MTTFTAQTYQNEYLAEGATEVNAIVTVAATGSGARAVDGPVQAAEIVIVDTSGSMAVPQAQDQGGQGGHVRGDRLHPRRRRVRGDRRHRRRAARLPDRPARWRSPARTPARRRGSRPVISERRGGTAIGSWLTLAAELFEGGDRHDPPRDPAHRRAEPGTRRRTSSTRRSRAARATSSATAAASGPTGRCGELRRIASTLLGTSTSSPSADDLVADFTAMIERRDGQGGRRRRAAPVDAAGSRGGVRQAGRADDRGPDVAAPGVGPCQRRLPHRRVGRRVARLPRVRRVPPRATRREMAAGASASWSTARRSARP